MKSYDLGKLKKVDDLRSIWPNEARDFSKWLAVKENLDMLGEAVGIDMSFEEGESPVGSFSVDLYATEENTGKKIIIENQLEDTDHDHLGKIITYASGKDAEVVIWIVKRARDEHRHAIEWLNENTRENIAFFLIEIELWQIDESRVAPMFNVVEQPNYWAKTVKAGGEVSETKSMYLAFWDKFNEVAFTSPFNKEFTKHKAMPQNWYDLSVGTSLCHLSLTVNARNKKIFAAIYINNNKTLYEKLQKLSNSIENAFGDKLIWREAKKDCRIYSSLDFDAKEDDADWNIAFNWFMQVAIKLKSIVNDYIKE